MFSLSSNIDEVITIITNRIEDINVEEMTALQASTAIAELRKRIHVDGKDSNDSQIGTYSDAYMKVRTGLYSNSKKSKKGIVKSAGVKTKGASKGTQRPKYQRKNDNKVILSLTSQMENDYTIIPEKNGCAIGFSNSFNYQKSQWNEKTYNKKIFSLTKKERDLVIDKAQEYINEQLHD